jgi:RNA polymerase sigma-70 factor (ECF subfamily)
MLRGLWHGRATSRTSDAYLCRAASLGEGEALSTLYRRHGGLIYRFSLRMSRDASVAEEVTHDVFLTFLKNPGQFDASRGKLSTWLCGIARRIIWKHLERSGRFEPFDEEGDAHSEADDPHMVLSRHETISAVRQGVESLPEQLREVIVLCEFEEMSYEEVASILAVPIGTVRSRLHRAKARLAKSLAGIPVSPAKESRR